VIPINPSATYLRHRVAVESAARARRRAIRWRRLLLALMCGLLYFAIGRDLIALARAKKDTVAMEIRHDVQTLSNDVQRMAGASQVQAAHEITSPVVFTSAAALANKESPDDIDAWLCGDPVTVESRAE
jgi:putative intracellular protease/amidase